ncbi:MAG: alpha/beta hydrolase [Methylophilus sp.]|nr:alpha/beta hydrolase [Methylophilus sp.]
MRYLADSAHNGHRANTLMILLPGATCLPEDFITQGFVQAVRDRSLDIDLMLVELPFDQIADQTALYALHRDVIQPVASQYQAIWLAGISIGGYIGMAYAHYYPRQVKGLFLMAPYPGNRITTGEIASAGGLHAWQPVDIANDDLERGNWYWLKHAKNVEIHLGYGSEDRFADGIALMEQAIPTARVDKVSGDHTWPVWQQLWSNFLDQQQARWETTRHAIKVAKS